MPVTPRVLAAGIALLLPGPRAWGAGTTNDLIGFYFVSTDGAGPEVRIDEGRTTWGAHPPIHTEDWRPIRLGEMCAIKIVGAKVDSDNNENTQFTLVVAAKSVVQPDDFQARLRARQVVLRFGERGYRLSGSGSRGNGRHDLLVTMRSREEALAAAQWLSVELNLRTSNKYKVEARFIPAKAEYSMNEPVMVRFELKNTGDVPVRFQEHHSYTRRRFQYDFQGKLSGQPVRASPGKVVGGVVEMLRLEPGEVFVRHVDLKNWLSIQRPGLYEINGFYALEIFSPIEETNPRAKKPPLPWPDSLSEQRSLPWKHLASTDFDLVVNNSPGPRMTEDQAVEIGKASLEGLTLQGRYHALFNNGTWEVWAERGRTSAEQGETFAVIRDLDGKVKITSRSSAPVVW